MRNSIVRGNFDAKIPWDDCTEALKIPVHYRGLPSVNSTGRCRQDVVARTVSLSRSRGALASSRVRSDLIYI